MESEEMIEREDERVLNMYTWVLMESNEEGNIILYKCNYQISLKKKLNCVWGGPYQRNLRCSTRFKKYGPARADPNPFTI